MRKCFSFSMHIAFKYVQVQYSVNYESWWHRCFLKWSICTSPALTLFLLLISGVKGRRREKQTPWTPLWILPGTISDTLTLRTCWGKETRLCLALSVPPGVCGDCSSLRCFQRCWESETQNGRPSVRAISTVNYCGFKMSLLCVSIVFQLAFSLCINF